MSISEDYIYWNYKHEEVDKISILLKPGMYVLTKHHVKVTRVAHSMSCNKLSDVKNTLLMVKPKYNKLRFSMPSSQDYVGLYPNF